MIERKNNSSISILLPVVFNSVAFLITILWSDMFSTQI